MNDEDSNDLFANYREFALAALTPHPDPIPDGLRRRLHALVVGESREELPTKDAATASLDSRIQGFVLESEIGRGGMAVVYRAWDETLARHVALKVLTRVSDPNQHLRFQREAQAAANVKSDYVVPIYSVGQTTDGRSYLVMPLIDGPTLRERIRTGPLSPREAADLIRTVAIGLSALHDAGILHRDIKPANILLDVSEGRAKLTDFGLARAMDTASLTQEGVIAGTPEYMSPEQAVAPGSLDARSDVYSLGVTLYECIAGTIPFRGTQLDIIRQRNESDPESPRRFNSTLPKDLETICLKATARDRVRRYSTATEFADDLGRWADGRPIAARPVGWPEHSVRWMKRNPLPMAVLVIGLCGAIVSTLGWSQAAKNARLAENRLQLAESSAVAERVQLERAEQHLATAREAVDRFYLRVIEEGLLKEPKYQTQRREVLTDAVTFYERMLAVETADSQLHSSAVRTSLRLGMILRDLGKNAEAEAMLRRSVQLAREVVEQDPNDHSTKLELLRGLSTLRLFLWESKQFAFAAEFDQECMTLCEALVLQFPEKVALRRDLAAMNANSAATALSKGDWAAARIGFEKAKEQFEQLVLLQPENALFRTDLARAEYNLGISFKDSDERIRHWELSRQMRRELLSKNPIPGILEKEFVKNCINLSAERQSRKEYAQALEVAFDAVKTAKAYLKDITDKPFQELLASAWILVAEASAELSQLDQAENAYCEADLVYQSLFKVDAKNYLEKAHAYSKEYMLFLTSRGKAKEAELTRLRVIESIDLVIQATPVGSPERAHFEEYRKQFEIRNDFPKTTPPKKTAPQETQAVCSHRKV